MQRLFDTLFLPLHLLLVAFGRFQYWLSMRPWILLLQGLPALAVGLLLPGIGLYESRGWDRGALQLYQQLANEAVDKRERAAAGIYLRKLQMLNEHGLETRYVTARLAEMNGQSNDVERLMHELAPLEGRGHPRAHFWVATHMLRERVRFSPEQAKQLLHHLNAALASDRDRQAARILLADIERSRGNREAAARHLEAVVLDRPEMRVALAAIYSDLGDVFRARQERERAVEHFRREAGRDAGNADAVILWAKALAVGGDFELGEKVFLDALENQQPAESPATKQRVEVLNRRLADHYVEWSDHLAKDQRDVKRRIELLQKALAAAPGHVGALNRLALLAAQAGPKDDSVRDQISQVLVGQDIPALARLILGTSAATRADWGEAQEQLEQALPDMQQAPVLLNNLAWVLLSAEPPQLDRAFSMADAAANALPQHPEIRETRGMILARLGRWTEALADLEIALAAFPDRAVIYDTLADAYQHLGDPDMAARHRELAAKKREKEGKSRQ